MRPCNARMCTRTRDARDTLALRARYARDTSSNIAHADGRSLKVLKSCCKFLDGPTEIRIFAASSTNNNTMTHVFEIYPCNAAGTMKKGFCMTKCDGQGLLTTVLGYQRFSRKFGITHYAFRDVSLNMNFTIIKLNHENK